MARRRSAAASRTLLGTAVTVLVAVLVWLFADEDNGSDGSPARISAAADSDAASTVVSTGARSESDDTPPATATRPATTTTASPTRTDPVVADGFGTIAAADLPPEGRDTLELIDSGGPFPYDQDASTFQNREGILPDRPTGYYQEYTVETPGSDDRGARRIVTGEEGEVYYTEDHYDSFVEVLR